MIHFIISIQIFLSFIRVLEEELGIHCNMTLLFSFAQVSKCYIITEFP